MVKFVDVRLDGEVCNVLFLWLRCFRFVLVSNVLSLSFFSFGMKFERMLFSEFVISFIISLREEFYEVS